MSITVRPTDGPTAKYDDATEWNIEDGHLFILAEEGGCAIYAPGAWAAAWQDDDSPNIRAE